MIKPIGTNTRDEIIATIRRSNDWMAVSLLVYIFPTYTDMDRVIRELKGDGKIEVEGRKGHRRVRWIKKEDS